MIDFIANHIGELASLVTFTSIILGAIWRSHKKLHQDMIEIKQDCKSAHQRIDAMGHKIDNMGKRIDGVYEVIIKMLDKR